MPYIEAAVRRQQFIAAARIALLAHGVAKTSLRVVAAEAGVPLATMQYVFPSKEKLLRAVIEDVVDEIAHVLADSAATDQGLANAIRQGLDTYWGQLVRNGRELQLLQYELTMYALRTPGHEDLARVQYERYAAVVADWCRHAAEHAGETAVVSFDHLGRMIVAGVDGLILQYVCDPDDARARKGLEALAEMAKALAGV
ncbi:TetR/AcrR family transcriptional regulator [Saccharopolyspora sp. TS4A08]|uniref:TetR/AcrR family transcriptional regulator n=1 Tax=Saccharopolyspora ipomoeae TaxID=3042027 RepID=A0ABT6PWR9_9PSEU|nr:TetR/AcrR family transcriptional regulator [Saccharopolyspora sp. TS4A08]MDI2032463.1 TetR/AcrR family transcriptional regulator [Saccharopolyspora sp. TS4A08]